MVFLANTIRELSCGYIESIKDELYDIVDFLYNNPESSFNEKKSSGYLSNFLKNKGFDVTEDIGGVNHSFIARFGSGSPAVAYICEYDCSDEMEHVSGHNITSAISIGAACGIKHVLDSIGGSVVVIGCPAEEKYYTKIKMLNEGIFENIDAVICGSAMNKTCESGTSLGMKQVKISFSGRSTHTSIGTESSINALTPCINLCNLVNSLNSKYSKKAFINAIIEKGGENINRTPRLSECTFMVKSDKKNVIDDICDDIIKSAEFIGGIFMCSTKVEFPEAEYMPLETNMNLSKVLCHNLKERGIDDIHGPVTMSFSLDIGNISNKIPTVQPYIGICKEPIEYYTKEFAECTITPYAKEMALKASCALALTGIDIIQKPDIIKKRELQALH